MKEKPKPTKKGKCSLPAKATRTRGYTHKCFLIEQFRETMLGDKLEWDSEKVWRFSTYAQLTISEIAYLVGLTPSRFEDQMKRGFSLQTRILLFNAATAYGFYR